jgi:hypothetical protein
MRGTPASEASDFVAVGQAALSLPVMLRSRKAIIPTCIQAFAYWDKPTPQNRDVGHPSSSDESSTGYSFMGCSPCFKQRLSLF